MTKEKYLKYWNDLSGEKADKIWEMYIQGEMEIMGLARNKVCQPKDDVCAGTPAPTLGDILGVVKQKATVGSQQEVENTMNTNTERDYLARRLDNVLYTFQKDLANEFHIHEDTNPRTYKELIEWIKKDKYELDTKQTKYIDRAIDDGDEFYGSFIDGIIWTGRAKKDRAGYDKAIEACKKAYQNAKDIVMSQDAEQGLGALKKFEAWSHKN